jgi:hypothetical protein
MFDAQGFDGIISLPVLHDVLATLDFPGRQLILERGSLPAANGRDVLSIAGEDRAGRLDLPMQIGDITAAAVIDTRSFLWIILPETLQPKLTLANSARDIGTAGGPSLGQFHLRGRQFGHRISARFQPRPASRQWDSILRVFPARIFQYGM